MTPGAFYLEDDTALVIILSGSGFAEGAEIFLRPRDKNAPDIIPLSVTVENTGQNMILNFDATELSAGNYDIYIRNPGGLETSVENFKIAFFKKSLNVNISIGYAPLIPLYGKFFNAFDKFEPLGAYARISVIPLKKTWGYLGAELEPFWNSPEGDNASVNLIGGHINLLYQRQLQNRVIVLNGRLGAGITTALDYRYDNGNNGSASISSFYISAGAGASVQWFIHGPFFLELGIEYNHILTTADSTQPGYLRPMLGAGFRF
jgi:hypothetical protein